MVKKKKNKLLSGYYDASTSKNVTDANIEENDKGWKIVKNQNSSIKAPISKTHAQQYNLNGSKKIAPTVSITTNNIVKQGTTNLVNRTLQQDLKNKIFEAATGQNKQKIDLSGKTAQSTTPVTKEGLEIQRNQLMTEKELQEKRDKLSDELFNYDREEKVKWWDDDLSFVENLKNVGYKTFLENKNNKYVEDEKYNELKRRFELADNELKNKKVQRESTNMDTLDKIGYTITGNVIDSTKGIESTVNKLFRQYTPVQSESFDEMMAQEARKQTSGIAGAGLDIVGSMSKMLPQMIVSGPINSSAAAMTVGFANYGGSAYNEAKQMGATEEQATAYGITIGGLETGLEKLLGGFESVYGKSALGNVTNKIMGKVITNTAFRQVASGMAGEFTEEYLQEFLQPIVRNAILEEENGADFWNAENLEEGVKQFVSQLFNSQNLYAGTLGAVSSGLMSGPSAISQNASINNEVKTIKEDINPKNIEEKMSYLTNKGYDTNTSIEIVNKALKETGQPQISVENIAQNETAQEVTSNTPQISQEIGQNQELSNETINNSQNIQYSQIENNKKKIAPVFVKYEKSDNQKINNYRQSAIRERLYDNEKTRLLMNVSEKLIQEKGYNIVFDRTITNEKGQHVNAQIKTLDNGEIEIRVNPNSERAGEFLLIHEVSHAIKTQDMIDYVNKFASKNKTFAESVKSLEQQYGKDLTSEEVFADVCGQLFGNQEFIDSLTMENTPQSRNIIKKVYESIKRLLNNFTTEGRYKNFVQDLETKWREAYNSQQNNLDGKTEYSFISTKGLKNAIKKDGSNLKVKSWLKQAQQLDKSIKKDGTNYTNEEIRQATGWFKDSNGKWLIELSDKNANFNDINNIQTNKVYKIKEIFNHPALFEAYPELENGKIEFKTIKNDKNGTKIGAYYDTFTKKIVINDFLLETKYQKYAKNLLLHEMQHMIQQIEGLEKGDKGKNYIRYYTNLGEIQSSDVEQRSEYDYNDIKEIIPKSAQENPVHPYLEKLHENPNLERTKEALKNPQLEKLYNKIYNNDEGGQYVRKEINKKGDTVTNSKKGIFNNRRGWNNRGYFQEELDNSSFSYDNQGRRLTKEQQEYFKDTKAVDENGNLKVLYHGTPNEFNKFSYEFLGTNGTLLGKGFYLTDDTKVAEAYAYKGENGKVMELYADIKKPLKWGETTITKQQFQKFVEAVNQATEGRLFADYSGEFSEKGSQQYNSTLNDILMDYEYGGDDIDLVSGILNTTGMSWDKGYRILKDTTGYDGIIVTTDVYDSGEGNVYIPFQSNQIKNVDNTNPTLNEDIRYSQKNQTWQEHLEENYKATGTRTYFNEITDSNKKALAPIVRENNEINKSRNTNILIAKEQNTDNVKKKIINAKVKTKKNNNGLKSARMAAKIAQNKMDLSNNEKNEFKKELMKYKGYTREKLTNARTYNEIKDIVKKYSDREISYANREIQDIKDYIRNTKLEVTQELKNSITDYNDFRKSNFGKLKLSNEGMSIDSFYEELSQTYPGYFSNEIETDEDRLYAIADFMNEDSIITEKYSLDDKTIDDITSKVFNTLQENAFSKEQIEQFEKEISDRMSKITRKSVREMLQKQMGITAEDLSIGKDIKSPNYQITDPIRVNEKVFGRELGDKINNETIRKTTHNEARKIRWLNSERNDIKELGIKPRSKESAAVQKYGEKQYLNKNGELVKYGDKELRAEFPNEKTQEKIKRAAEIIRNKYDKYIDEINQTLTSLGYDAIPKRADYMRHFQELGDIFSKTGVPFNLNDMRAEDLPTDINGLTEFNRPGKNYFASAQKRIGQKTTYDAITGIDGYLEGAGNLIYHTADIQRYRALSSLIRDSFGSSKGFDNLGNLTDAQAEQRVNDILDNKLSRYAAWLDEQANNLAGKKGAIDRGVERFLGRKVYTGLNTIKKQVGSNMTGFNVRSALTNLISSTIASAKTNKLAFVRGTASTIRNMFKNDGFADKSDFLTTRFGSDQLSKKMWQKASNAGQIFMTGTDYFTANQITRSKYYEGLQKGMSESEAIKYADDFASRVMGDRSLGRTAEAFNSKTLGLLTQFQLEVNNQWQYMIHDTVMDYQKNSQINGGLKAGATALFQMGQLAAFSYFFNEVFEALTGSRAAFDPVDILKKLFASDDDEDKPLDERISEANKELFDNIPFGNLFTGGGRIPISEAFKGVNTFTKKITGGKNQYGGDITWEDVGTDALGSLPYYLLPTGYSQAKKTTKGLSMFDKDKETTGSYTKGGDLRFPVKDTTANKIQAGLFGEYSSKNAREYFDNGYSAMGTNQQKMYKTLNIPISDYWEIRKEINSIKSELKGTDKSTEERKKIFYEYIDSLDVSNIKKSILKKSIYKSYDEADGEIKEYINSSKMSKQSKKDLLKELGLDD